MPDQIPPKLSVWDDLVSRLKSAMVDDPQHRMDVNDRRLAGADPMEVASQALPTNEVVGGVSQGLADLARPSSLRFDTVMDYLNRASPAQLGQELERPTFTRTLNRLTAKDPRIALQDKFVDPTGETLNNVGTVKSGVASGALTDMTELGVDNPARMVHPAAVELSAHGIDVRDVLSRGENYSNAIHPTNPKAQDLIGGYYKSYGGGVDKIIDIRPSTTVPGSSSWVVRDVGSGRFRTHSTPIDPGQVVKSPFAKP